MIPGIEDITVELSVVLGTSTMPVHQLLRMGRGAVIELDTQEDEDVIILANKTVIAQGKVSVNGEKISVSVTELRRRQLSRG